MAPAGVPAADVLPGDAELAGNLGLGAAGGKQLIGHSMGGDVVVEAVRRLGDRVAGLVWGRHLQHPGGPPAEEELEAFLGPFREDFAAATGGLVGHFLMLEAPDRFNRLLGEVIEEFRS